MPHGHHLNVFIYKYNTRLYATISNIIKSYTDITSDVHFTLTSPQYCIFLTLISHLKTNP